jgi:hypothetical protein
MKRPWFKLSAWRIGLALVLAAVIAVILWQIALPAIAQSPVKGQIRLVPLAVGTPYNGDLRNLPPVPRRRTPMVIPEDPLYSYEQPRPRTASTRSSNQVRSEHSNMPSPSVTFPGLYFDQDCGGEQCGTGWPPDTNGDVGPTYYIQTVNDSYAIYRKDGLREVAQTFDTLFQKANTGTLCDNTNQTDPVVIYDELADRWLLTDLAFNLDMYNHPAPPVDVCIAVSQSSDPLSGGWYFYALVTDNVMTADYPKFGLWPDAYYMNMDMFSYSLSPNPPPPDRQDRVVAFDRSAMLNGQKPVNAQVYELDTCLGTSTICPHFHLLPANLRNPATFDGDIHPPSAVRPAAER